MREKKRKWEIGNQSNIMNQYNYVQHKHEQKKNHEIIAVFSEIKIVFPQVQRIL